MSYFQQTIVQGVSDNGMPQSVGSTPEGHLEIAIHAPTLPFGAVHTENLHPVFQADPLYGINNAEVIATTGLVTGSGANSATSSAASNLFSCSTGTTIYSFGTLHTRRQLRYRPGQGAIGRFSARFSAPAASSILIAGLGTSESGFYFGYNGISFGILHSTGGVREIQTMTITAASTATNNYNVTLPSGQVVNVTATNNGSTVKTAYEISQGTYPGWSATQRGSTVLFLANDVGPKAAITLGQSGASTPAVGANVETLEGVASTDTWIPQASWNGDPMDGTGRTGFNLVKTNLNVFQIGVQYLGAGCVTFQVEVPSTDSGNNGVFVNCHTINFPNTSTSTSVTQPSFPFTMGAYSKGSTTNVSVFVGSLGGFLEGLRELTGPRQTYTATSTAVTAGSYRALLTVRNERVFGNRANQVVINLLSFGGAHDDTTPVTLYLIRNGILAGTPNFTAWASSSSTYVDSAATTCTVTSNDQIVFSMPLGASGYFLFSFDDNVTLQPGETVTLAAQTVTGTASYTIVCLNTREDQ